MKIPANAILLIFILYSILLLVLTVYPSIDLPRVPKALSFDKVAHVGQFFIFAFLYFKVREKMPKFSTILKKRYPDTNPTTKSDYLGCFTPLNEKIKNMSQARYVSAKDIYLELFFWGILLPVFTEALQIPIRGREFCWYDILANQLGFYLFIILSLALTPFARGVRGDVTNITQASSLCKHFKKERNKHTNEP